MHFLDGRLSLVEGHDLFAFSRWQIEEQQARAAEFAKENAARERNEEEDSGGLFDGREASLRRTAHGFRQVRRGRHNKEQAGGMQWLSPTQNRAVERDLSWAEGKAAPVTSIVEKRADKAIDGKISTRQPKRIVVIPR